MKIWIDITNSPHVNFFDQLYNDLRSEDHQVYITCRDLANTARVSYRAKLDKTFPKGIHIGAESYIASGAIVFSHDYSRNLKTHTYIGKKCFIGANVVILPGIKIGDEVIVGSGSIVTKDIPSNSIVVGNPAKIIKSNIKTKKFGQLIE